MQTKIIEGAAAGSVRSFVNELEKDLFDTDQAIVNKFFLPEARKAIAWFKKRYPELADTMTEELLTAIISEQQTYPLLSEYSLEQIHEELTERQVPDKHVTQVYEILAKYRAI